MESLLTQQQKFLHNFTGAFQQSPELDRFESWMAFRYPGVHRLSASVSLLSTQSCGRALESSSSLAEGAICVDWKLEMADWGGGGGVRGNWR